MFLCLPLLCSAIGLRDENFRPMMERYADKPFLILFVDANSDEIKETLKAIDFNDLVYFGEVQSQSNPKLCSFFGKRDGVSLAFYDEACDQIEWMHGPVDEESVKQFIHSQISFPIQFVHDKRIAGKQTGFGSNFLVTYKDQYDPRIRMLKIAASSVRSSDAKFYAVKGKSLSLKVYRSYDAYNVFRGDWSLEDLSNFISRNFFPFLLELNEITSEKLKPLQPLLLVAVIEPMRSLVDLRKLAQEIDSEFPVTYVKFTESHPLVRFIRIKQDDLPCTFLYDLAKKRWIPYSGAFSAPEIQEWLGTLDTENAAWHGGGHRRVFFSLSLAKRPTPYIIIIVVVVLLLAFCGVFGKRPANRRQVAGFNQLKSI